MTTGSGPTVPPVAGEPAGPREPFAPELLLRHRRPLLRYVRGLVHGDVERAEDIVQETLVRAALLEPALARGVRSPQSWLYRVARNLVIDAYRRERARPREVADAAPLERAAVADAADEVAARRDVLTALAGLAPMHREVLWRLYYLDQTGPQVAAHLGLPVATVKSRSRHAIEILRRALYAEAGRRASRGSRRAA